MKLSELLLKWCYPIRGAVYGPLTGGVIKIPDSVAKAPRPIKWYNRPSKRQWRQLAGVALTIMLVLSAMTGTTLSRYQIEHNAVAYRDAKLEHVFVEPMVQSILAANQHDTALKEQVELLREIVRHSADSCFRRGCDVKMLLSVFRVESNYKPGAKNPTSGAKGLGQVMRLWGAELKTRKLCSVPMPDKHDPYGIANEIEDAAMVLVHYKARAKGDYVRALWGYYAGDGRLWNPDGDIRNYANKVMAVRATI